MYKPIGIAGLMAALVLAPSALAQVFKLTPEQMTQYTAQNPYDRFPDGRPKVPDALIEKLKSVSIQDLAVLAQRGYRNQFEPATGWQMVHADKKLVGRAMTVQLMPTRNELGAANPGRGNHQTAIDVLQSGDVMVMDAAGPQFGGIIGDNLTYYIMKTTGAGFIIDGAIRDLEGITPMNVDGYFRAAIPPAIHDLTLTGINIPVRIGSATVMPGDIVFGTREGIYFIPPALVQAVLDAADARRKSSAQAGPARQ